MKIKLEKGITLGFITNYLKAGGVVSMKGKDWDFFFDEENFMHVWLELNNFFSSQQAGKKKVTVQLNADDPKSPCNTHSRFSESDVDVKVNFEEFNQTFIQAFDKSISECLNVGKYSEKILLTSEDHNPFGLRSVCSDKETEKELSLVKKENNMLCDILASESISNAIRKMSIDGPFELNDAMSIITEVDSLNIDVVAKRAIAMKNSGLTDLEISIVLKALKDVQ